MKVRGDNAPANAFSLEEQPDKPGYCLVRFYENVTPFSETQGELTVSGFEYDEYHLELPAKLAEAEKETIPKLKQQVSDLQSVNEGLSAQITQAQLALCDVYELVIGG